jgi:hypothetical protein
VPERPPSRCRTPATLTAEERAAIAALATDLPALWHAPTTGDIERKELLRILIEQITVAVVGNSELVDVTITWAGGHQTHGQAVRPVARLDQLSYYDTLLATVERLAAAGLDAPRIAEQLNAAGLRPPKRTNHFTGEQVRSLIARNGLRTPGARAAPVALQNLGPDQWTVTGLAAELGMPTATVHNWIVRGWIHAAKTPGHNFWIIQADPAELQRLRTRRSRPAGYYSRQRWTQPTPAEPTPEGQPT